MKAAMLLSSVLVALLIGAPSHSEDDGGQSVGPLLWQPSMNVFRRFAVEPEKMFEFYGEVLGLEQLQTYNVGGNTAVARFKAGDSEIKLTGRVANREYVPGGIRDATGLRLLTFFFPDEAALVERFREHGYAAPRFDAIPGSPDRKMALVSDPDGQSVELIVAPNAPANTFDGIEVGLTVSDIEASRRFYGDFVGLEALPAVEDALFETVKFPYRNGSTIVNLRSFGEDLPRDTGTGGIQYVVSKVETVNALAKAQGVEIDQPLSTLQGFGVRTVWLDDPDGITNYFAETQQSRQAATAGGPHD